MTEMDLKQIILYYGDESQKTKAVEELSELIKAICKNDRENIIEEIADVKIMIGQLYLIYDIPIEKIWEKMDEKLRRTKERMYNDDVHEAIRRVHDTE